MVNAVVRLTAVFKVTRNTTVELPVKEWESSTCSHIALLLAAKSQFGPAVTSTVKTPPFVGGLSEFELNEKVQTVGFCSAAATFSRPFARFNPVNVGKASAVFINVALSEATESEGYWAARRAAAPATCGADIDVPFRNA